MARGSRYGWGSGDKPAPALRPKWAGPVSEKTKAAQQKWQQYRKGQAEERQPAAKPVPERVREDFARNSTPLPANDPDYGKERLSIALGTDIEVIKSQLSQKAQQELEGVINDLRKNLKQENERLEKTRDDRLAHVERDMLRDELSTAGRGQRAPRSADEIRSAAETRVNAEDGKFRDSLIEYSRLRANDIWQRERRDGPERGQTNSMAHSSERERDDAG